MCDNIVEKYPNYIKKRKNIFCTKKCFLDFGKSKYEKINCKNCNKEIIKMIKDTKRYKNSFCSLSCNAQYFHTHKSFGYRRSKLEKWLEVKFGEIYPNLEVHYNKTNTINAELDIYFPSIKFAVELNGIFHYEPIFGEETLKRTKNNDNRKFQACLEQGIELCIIDVSKAKKFKPERDKQYLDIILNILNNKLQLL